MARKASSCRPAPPRRRSFLQTTRACSLAWPGRGLLGPRPSEGAARPARRAPAQAKRAAGRQILNIVLARPRNSYGHASGRTPWHKPSTSFGTLPGAMFMA